MQELVKPAIRGQSAVARQKLPTGKWKRWGKIDRAQPWERSGELTEDVNTPPVAQLPEGELMAIGDPTTGEVSSVRFSQAELEAITAALEARGFAEGRAGDAPSNEEEGFVPKGWSNGTDNRTALGIHEQGLSASNYARNGQLDSHCSATLIGTPETDYYVITAAHCLFASGTGTYLDPDFRPRRDSCKTNTGASIAGCDTAPYGAWSGGQYMTYQYWLDNCRGDDTPTSACIGRDIALVRVSRPSGEGFPGAHGFGNYSDATIKATTTFNRGYPNCGGDGDPDDTGGSASPSNVCRSSTLYGTSGTIDSTTESGRRSSHNMDTSGGMSGSSLYINSSGAKVYAVHNSGTSGCFDNCAQAFPSNAARITSTYYGWMLDFMGI